MHRPGANLIHRMTQVEDPLVPKGTFFLLNTDRETLVQKKLGLKNCVCILASF